MLSPRSWEGLAALAAEGVAQELDDEARRQRQHVPAGMFGANPVPPRPHLLKAIRAGAQQPPRAPWCPEGLLAHVVCSPADWGDR